MLNIIIASVLLFTNVPIVKPSGFESKQEVLGGQEDIYLNMEEKFERLVALTLKKQEKERLQATNAQRVVLTPTETEPRLKSFKTLVLTTFNLETGYGTSALWKSHNNAGGIKCGANYCYYNNPSDGISALENLLTRYVEKYGFNFEAIRSVWSESDDTALFTQMYYEQLNKMED